MKNILHIALAIVFVLSGVAVSAAQIRPTGSTLKIERLPLGGILVTRQTTSILPPLKRVPIGTILPPLKQPTVGNSLALWATKHSVPVLLPPPAKFTPFKPSPFNSPMQKPVKPLDDWKKTSNDWRNIELARSVSNGVIGWVLKQQEKDRQKQESNLFTSSTYLPASGLTFNEPQVKPANKTSAPFVVITSDLTKSAPQAQPLPTLLPANSGLTANSSLKVVHITADGTVILIDDRNNYYSLSPNSVRNSRGTILQDDTKPVNRHQSPRRNHSRSRN